LSGKARKWQFARSPEFVATRDALIADFERETAATLAKHDPDQARLCLDKLKRFRSFLKLVDAIETGDVKPEDYLVFVCDVGSGEAYSLISDRWRCFYLVDRRAPTCMAVQIDAMTETGVNSEYARRHPGPTPWFRR